MSGRALQQMLGSVEERSSSMTVPSRSSRRTMKSTPPAPRRDGIRHAFSAHPADLTKFLERPNPAVVASINPHGELHTAATWYEVVDDATILLNMGDRERDSWSAIVEITRWHGWKAGAAIAR